ncbi:MAG: DUF4270 domain-containing protein [Bacteroidia bacterium]|nr:DUF4270 domain-containing protein [Bacteroidia bacterium]
MKSILNRNLALAISLLTVLFFSCQKDPTTLGLDLQPDSDRINGISLDSSTVKAFFLKEDSLTTDERTYALLGSYFDPIFGRSDASFMTHIRLSSSNVSFGTVPVVDSIVLYLKYRSYYGDTNTAQTISVYEIDKDFYLDSTYYSNINPSQYILNNTLLATKSYYPKPSGEPLAITLSNSMAVKILAGTSTNLSTNDEFLKFFKGLYVKTDSISSGGAIIYYDLINSKVTLYYKNNNDDSLKFDFLINSSSARINLFKHNYSSVTINSSIGDSLASDSLLYIQGMSGLMAKIRLPYLSTLKDSATIAIVKAELIIPVEDYDATLYKTPANLILVSYNSSGKYEFLPDYWVGGNSYFGGTYNSSDKTYRFNISRYAQQLVDETRIDYGLALFVGDNRVSANRLILRGPKCVNNGMKLSITYLKP